MANVDYSNAQSIQYVKAMQEAADRSTIVLKEIKFDESIKTNLGGLRWKLAVSSPWGFTPSASYTERTLSSPEPYQFKEATATPYNLELSQRIPLDHTFANESGIVEFIKDTIKDCGMRMAKNCGFRLEDDCIYGQLPIAQVDSVAASNTGDPVGGAHGGTFTVETYENRPGYFYNSIGLCFDIFGDTTYASKANTNGRCKITSWDPATLEVGFSCAAGDVTAINNLTNDALIFHEGVKTGDSTFLQMQGIVKSLSTQSGNLFGVPVAYPINRAGYTDLSAATPTVTHLLDALANLAITSGGSKLSVYASDYWWRKIANTLAVPSTSTRHIDASYSSNKITIGSSKYDLAGLHDGLVEIKMHPGLKAKDCLILDKSSWARTGTTDWTFKIPGLDSEVIRVPATNVLEMYSYTSQMIVPKVASKNFLLTNAGGS